MGMTIDILVKCLAVAIAYGIVGRVVLIGLLDLVIELGKEVKDENVD